MQGVILLGIRGVYDHRSGHILQWCLPNCVICMTPSSEDQRYYVLAEIIGIKYHEVDAVARCHAGVQICKGEGRGLTIN